MNRLQLENLNPSLANPITLVCTTDYFIGKFKKITVIGFTNDYYINIIDSQNYAGVLKIDILKNLEVCEEKPQIETLYECLTKFGEVRFLFEDGSHPNFETKTKGDMKRGDAVERRLGRTLTLNMKTGEYTLKK